MVKAILFQKMLKVEWAGIVRESSWLMRGYWWALEEWVGGDEEKEWDGKHGYILVDWPNRNSCPLMELCGNKWKLSLFPCFFSCP